jgi:hypothetical protein
MSKTSTYPSRLPKSLKDQAARVAKRDGTSINQFIAIAVTEKGISPGNREILFRTNETGRHGGIPGNSFPAGW